MRNKQLTRIPLLILMTLKNFFYMLFALALLFIGIHRVFMHQTDSLETVASSVLYPVILFQNYLVKPVQRLYGNWLSNAYLQKQLATTQATIDMLQAELIALQATKDVMESTTELRDFASRYYPTGQLAHIIMKEFDTHQTYTIDVGSHKGIELDMVAVYNNCLIGRVSTVYPYWSKVTLITDPACKVAAYTAISHISGIHEGALKLDVTQLAFVSHLQQVSIGELVISSGEGLVFPRGYALGAIKKVESEGFNLVIDVQPLVDLKKLSYCYIIKKGASLPPIDTDQKN